MSAYVTPPVFKDNVGQLVSQADLDILRHNVGLAEHYTWRWSELLANSGGIETAFTLHNYLTTSGDVSIAWDGYLMMKAGMTTLTVEGRTAAVGSSVFSLWIENTKVQQWIPGTSSWTITQALSGTSVGQVIRITIRVQDQGLNNLNGEIWIKDVYGSPLTFTDTWPGVPSFGTSFTDAQLTQLSNATSWVLNRTSLVPRAPMLSLRYGLGSLAGPDRRPVYSGTVGRYYSQQQLHLGFQVADNTLPDLRAEVWVNGTLAWESSTLPQGTTNLEQWISLASVPLGTRAEIEIWSNQHAAIPRTSNHFSLWTIWTCFAEANDASIYATPSLPPTAEVLTSQTALTAYLNTLASIVSNAKARIDNQPNFYNRVRAQRRWFSKYDKAEALAIKRNPPRFWRCGDAVVVNGKGVSLAYGGVTVPTNDRGVAYHDYTWNKTQQIIESDTLSTQVLWLDTVPGIYRGTAYYLSGEVHYAEETVL